MYMCACRLNAEFIALAYIVKSCYSRTEHSLRAVPPHIYTFTIHIVNHIPQTHANIGIRTPTRTN